MNPRPLVPFALAAALTAGCQVATRTTKPPPLDAGDEGAVYVYLEPVADDAARLHLTVGSLGLEGAGGTPVPLSVLLPDLPGKEPGRQRLLAAGRAPEGRYAGLVVGLRQASAEGSRGGVSLPLTSEPVRVAIPLGVARGRAVVVSLKLATGGGVGDVPMMPQFRATLSRPPLPQLAGMTSDTGTDAITVFDRAAKVVRAVFPAGREPNGIAIDPVAVRAYVALGGEDQVEVLDLATGIDQNRIRLRPGDRPTALRLTPDGQTAVVVNPGSNSASFVRTRAGVESQRVATGDQPWSILIDRSGRRGYVFNRASNSITVLDVANQSVVRAVATEAEPVFGQLNRAGDRLYVAQAASPYLAVLAVPEMTVTRRVHVGSGAMVLKVDPRTDLLYVARRFEPRLDVYDPYSMLSVDRVDLPGPANAMAIDETENTLLVLCGEDRALVVVDLGSRRVLAVLDVGSDPYDVAVTGERR